LSNPLFLLLAYRQEKHVGDAVRAALTQVGCELDILISDDCSDDGTWDAIQRAASDVIRRTRSRSIGTTAILG